MAGQGGLHGRAVGHVQQLSGEAGGGGLGRDLAGLWRGSDESGGGRGRGRMSQGGSGGGGVGEEGEGGARGEESEEGA